MIIDLHPDIAIQKLKIGAEQSPLLVIDNFVAEPERLIRKAGSKSFVPHPQHSFPGVRADAPLGYQHLITTLLRDLLFEYFQLRGRDLRFSLCHYSLVTTPPQRLTLVQRIPHYDSVDGNSLASVHYLFRSGRYGGTAFYRHRKTGFEYITEERKDAYFSSLESENGTPNMPEFAYINGDTPLYEQIARQDGVFNRIVIYPRNLLHSACIDSDFVPDANPLTGRLSINSFIDVI